MTGENARARRRDVAFGRPVLDQFLVAEPTELDKARVRSLVRRRCPRPEDARVVLAALGLDEPVN